MNIFPFFRFKPLLSRPARRLLLYGLYAVLCQLAMIWLHTLAYAECVSGALLAHRFVPMLEHSLMSLAILAIGIYLVERTILEGQT